MICFLSVLMSFFKCENQFTCIIAVSNVDGSTNKIHWLWSNNIKNMEPNTQQQDYFLCNYQNLTICVYLGMLENE